MRTVIQDPISRRYLRALGRWTDRAQDALAFVDSVRAMDYVIYHRVKNVILIPLAAPAEDRPLASHLHEVPDLSFSQIEHD